MQVSNSIAAACLEKAHCRRGKSPMFETGHAVVAGLLPFAISYALVAMLPSANFAVITQAALTASRATALSAAAGVALGASSLAAIVVTGAGALPLGSLAHHMAASL